MRISLPYRICLLLGVSGGLAAWCLPVHAWDGGCPTTPSGLIGSRSFDARTTDCQEVTERPLVIRTEEIELGATLSFLAAGFPGKWDHHIRLVDLDSGATHPIRFWAAPGEVWVVKTIEVPAAWLGRRTALEGIDPDLGGAWVGFSGPLSRRDLSWLRWAPRLRAISMTTVLLFVLALAAAWAERKGARTHV